VIYHGNKSQLERRFDEAKNSREDSWHLSGGAPCLPGHRCQGIALAAEKEPVVGYNAGNVKFSAPLSAEDASYLGLAKPAPFTLKDIKADYVLVESMNTT